MTVHNLLFSAVGAALLMTLPSCDNNDYDQSDLLLPTAIVTVCPNTDGSFVMQLDDETQLIPANLNSSPFGDKEVRALVNYSETALSAGERKAMRHVNINWIDSIRTKLPAATLGPEDESVYGNDPLEIVQDWTTVAEDGYLTLRVRTRWGSSHDRHAVNLITGTNPDDPYELELRHDANGDIDGRWGDALIAFNLNKLPGADAGAAKIKLKWKSFLGDKSTEFDLKMRPVIQDIDVQNIRHSGQIQ